VRSFLFIFQILGIDLLHSADDLPRLIHHLGPRYTGTFQDPELVKFLTYEASTSLNMYLFSASAAGGALGPQESTGPGNRTKGAQTPIMKALKEGLPSIGLKEDTIVFVLAPAEFAWGVEGGLDSDSNPLSPDMLSPGVRSPRGAAARAGGGTNSNRKSRLNAVLCGDIFVVKAESLDVALWKIGGAAVGLRLVQLASVRSFAALCYNCMNIY